MLKLCFASVVAFSLIAFSLHATAQEADVDDDSHVATTAPADQPTSTLDEVAQGMAMTRIDRWAGSYNGCMSGATPEERAMASSLEYTCACLATYIVNLCAPNDMTTNDQVMQCVTVNEAAMQSAFMRCLTYGTLHYVE